MEDIQYFTKFPVEQLVFNHRLPKKIARVAQYLNSENDELEERCTEEGTEKPKILGFPSVTAQYDAIISLIRSKNMEDVGILFRHNADVQTAYDYFKSKGLNVEAKFGKQMDLDFTSDNPKMMTYHSSKGLQFEYVFLPNCIVEGNDDRNPLYVAITRSYRGLYIITQVICQAFLMMFRSICMTQHYQVVLNLSYKFDFNEALYSNLYIKLQ